MDLFGDTFLTLQKALDLRVINNRVITSNLANVDTPGFKAHRLDFEASMQQAIEQIEASGVDPNAPPDLNALARDAFGSDTEINPIIEPTNEPVTTLDGNNVNMEGELSRLGHNATMYRVTAQLLASKLRQIETILDGERG
jgi:flagellar basal-body rod protein FlgB